MKNKENFIATLFTSSFLLAVALGAPLASQGKVLIDLNKKYDTVIDDSEVREVEPLIPVFTYTTDKTAGVTFQEGDSGIFIEYSFDAVNWNIAVQISPAEEGDEYPEYEITGLSPDTNYPEIYFRQGSNNDTMISTSLTTDVTPVLPSVEEVTVVSIENSVTDSSIALNIQVPHDTLLETVYLNSNKGIEHQSDEVVITDSQLNDVISGVSYYTVTVTGLSSYTQYDTVTITYGLYSYVEDETITSSLELPISSFVTASNAIAPETGSFLVTSIDYSDSSLTASHSVDTLTTDIENLDRLVVYSGSSVFYSMNILSSEPENKLEKYAYFENDVLRYMLTDLDPEKLYDVHIDYTLSDGYSSSIEIGEYKIADLSDSGLGSGAIAGIVIGSLVFVALIGFGGYYYYNKVNQGGGKEVTY